MLQAQLKGKLTRQEEHMEDLLVSNVFGSIKYVEPQKGIGPIIASSEDAMGKSPNICLNAISNVKYKFWPSITEIGCNGCEPDVLITIELYKAKKIILMVEAKYLSDKSSEADSGMAPNDQLAREYDNLMSKARREETAPILLYVTADFGYPKDSIAASIAEYSKKRIDEMRVFWISWRKITKLLKNAKKESILGDLKKVLERQGLTYFEGVTEVDFFQIGWSFNSTNLVWSSFGKFQIIWDFDARKTFEWNSSIKNVNWRFQT